MSREKPITEEETVQIHRDDAALGELLVKLDKDKLVLDAKIVDTLIRLGQDFLKHKIESRAGILVGLQDLLDHPPEEVEKRREEIEDLLNKLKDLKPE
ncbi:MAG: hypothetical protein WC027_01535 [Candidatus Paceibacterota bacterium]